MNVDQFVDDEDNEDGEGSGLYPDADPDADVDVEEGTSQLKLVASVKVFDVDEGDSRSEEDTDDGDDRRDGAEVGDGGRKEVRVASVLVFEVLEREDEEDGREEVRIMDEKDGVNIEDEDEDVEDGKEDRVNMADVDGDGVKASDVLDDPDTTEVSVLVVTTVLVLCDVETVRESQGVREDTLRV